MQRIFVDMDGVLAKWNPNATIEELHSQGYFSNLEPETNMVSMVKNLLKENQLQVCVLSAVFDNAYSISDKRLWLEKHLPELPYENCFFSPNGGNKSDFIGQKTGQLYTTDILLDDYTKNLLAWHGVPVKVRNGLNGKRNKWDYFVDATKDALYLTEQVLLIAEETDHIRKSSAAPFNQYGFC